MFKTVLSFIRRHRWWFLALFAIPLIFLIWLIFFADIPPEPPFVYEIF